MGSIQYAWRLGANSVIFLSRACAMTAPRVKVQAAPSDCKLGPLPLPCLLPAKRGRDASFLGGMSFVAAHPQEKFAVVAVLLPIE